MQTRRDFLKSAAMLSGTAFVLGSVPEAIARALAIDPETGTTFMDAEHVVILMQENRSFDHTYGALQGVRGYGDPRPHIQPNGNSVWFQTDLHGDTYAPFRLDIHNTKVTWIGGLPHSWTNQVDAHNGGRYDKWLIAKPKAHLPFTLGHYTRQDIPFYYVLADSFTICDQAFCSSLTGTTPNRLFLWTGNIRKDASDFPRVQNEDTDYDKEASWVTFPERLEEAGVSWRVYQNELSIDSGFQGEHDDWLGNFTDNPLEWFTQYQVRFSKSRRAYLESQTKTLSQAITDKQAVLDQGKLSADAAKALSSEIPDLNAKLKTIEDERSAYNDQTWEAATPKTKSLHEKAFSVNSGDSDFRSLVDLRYQDGDTSRKVAVPKGDVLHQFREDVESRKLPAVSWLVAPCNFSDHPGAAWYGAWYLSEVLDILTKDPDVWKKTVFILCYDENDGYFDHVPPFLAPTPGKPETGLVSDGIDTSVDVANVHGRNSSIGLGFRVPLVVASPWSRGGCVNSQVFDHTSIIQFVETWLDGKGKHVRETNISDWRRTVCGDLTTVFKPHDGKKSESPEFIARDPFIETIHKAKFKEMPSGGKPLGLQEIAQTKVGIVQEPGVRASCPLPYELAVDALETDKGLQVSFSAAKNIFGKRSQGSPFNAYVYGQELSMRNYAVKAGDTVVDHFPVSGAYHVRVDGPNGFMREFKSEAGGGTLAVRANHEKGKSAHGSLVVTLTNHDSKPQKVTLNDESYGALKRTVSVPAHGASTVVCDAQPGRGWYDWSIQAEGLSYRYAGRVETGRWGVSDPAMAQERA